jgi:AmiR/NasT family two-component response regulator
LGENSDRVDGSPASADGSVASAGIEAEVTRLILYADAQERRVRELQTTVSQLQSALDSRVLIERAVGMLAERLNLATKDAFELLRSAARSSRREVRALAEQITEFRGDTPLEVVDAFARYETQ